jgi:hypothetical protein
MLDNESVPARIAEILTLHCSSDIQRSRFSHFARAGNAYKRCHGFEINDAAIGCCEKPWSVPVYTSADCARKNNSAQL